MSNLTGLQNGVFNTLHLVDETGEQTEVRQLFIQGSIEQSIPNAPTSSQVLSIPGLVAEFREVADSYSRTETDTIIQNSISIKGQKGDTGAPSTVKGSKGEGGSVGPKGDKGSLGVKGDPGQKGAASSVKGSKGELGPKGDLGQKGEIGAKGSQGSPTNTSGFRLISDSYSRADIDTWIASSTTSINTNAQNIISNQIDISLLQVAINGINANLGNYTLYSDFTSTINAIQTQLNWLTNEVSNRPNLQVIIGGTSYTPYRLVVQGSGLYQASWQPTPKELVLTFQ